MHLDIAITPGNVAVPPAGRRPFWSTAGWGVLIMIVSTILQMATLAAAAAYDLFHLKDGFGPTSAAFVQMLATDAARGDIVWIAAIVSDLACVGVILWIVARKTLPIGDYLALTPVRRFATLKWAGILSVYVVLASGAAALFHVDFGGAVMGNLLTGSQWPWLFWIAVVIGAPAFEEGFFRGFLFRGFQASRLGTWGTIFLTAILWAAMHLQYNLYGIAFIAGTGILFGLARARTGSLLMPLALHAGMNFVETVAYTLNGA
jgi:membrane protease YdiL (CAAX protease family)